MLLHLKHISYAVLPHVCSRVKIGRRSDARGDRGRIFMSTLQYLRFSSKPVVKAKHFSTINLFHPSFSMSLSFSPFSLSVSLACLATASLWPLSLSLSGPLSIDQAGRQHHSRPWTLYYFYELSSCQGTNIYPSADRALRIEGWFVHLIYLACFRQC